ncbi:MAG TPA: four helix bundle protein [Candidatus Paceibacterota bacterium]|nr:four helix bundle protein [Candidatus Paceibacterota bacterium]
MATVRKFEDLLCWNKARELSREVYKAFRNINDRGLKDQIERAAVSVMSNIAEGFERGTKQEFLNYLFIAKGSAGEVRSQLYVALDVGYLNIETFKYLNSLALENSRLIHSFTEKVKGGASSGTQFKKIDKQDPLEEIVKDRAPELYERFYGKK